MLALLAVESGWWDRLLEQGFLLVLLMSVAAIRQIIKACADYTSYKKFTVEELQELRLPQDEALSSDEFVLRVGPRTLTRGSQGKIWSYRTKYEKRGHRGDNTRRSLCVWILLVLKYSALYRREVQAPSSPFRISTSSKVHR